MVGEDAHRAGGRGILGVGAARELLGEVDERPQRVGVEDRLDPLEDRRHALEAHPRVDALHRQLAERAVLSQVVGHEDVVPVLEVAIGVVAGPVVGAAELRATVEVHLRTRPAGAGVARLPEVLRARQRHDALLRDADRAPDLDRLCVRTKAELLVTLEDRHPDQLGIEAEALGGELPAPGDRLLLEVVAEAPVAEHLEEGQMAGGVADLVDVDRPEAALDVRDPRGGRLLLTLEVRLEGLHPGGGEQH